jgi:Ni/Fe-hydrogenase 1 B-type cytochrome subunit
MNGVANSPSYKRIYVWELPVRVTHWLNALSIMVLIVTGFLIGSPISIEQGPEAYQQYWFGVIRLFHFSFAYVLFFSFLVRFYWGFVGNRYARWRSFLPTSRRRWRELFEVLKVDILQTRLHGDISIGHNMLAHVSYLAFFLLLIFMSCTGFALLAPLSDFWLPDLFMWVTPLMGGEMAVRFWHHVGMWLFVVFFIIHTYLVFYHDYVEGRATTSSIVGGWKFEREDLL